jgi:phosphoadenosine phosphosulfate reductase
MTTVELFERGVYNTYDKYQKLLNLSFEDKVLRSQQLISSEIKKAKRPMVANSWGKDSMVVLHLVRSICKNVVVVFCNTGVQYRETYVYRDKVLKKWDLKNYYETKPIMSFWKCKDKYGYPEFRKMSRQRKGKKSATPKCCYYLKEKPMIDFIKENKIDCEFLGLQATESMVRRLSLLFDGEVFDSKKYGCRVVRPIMGWTDKDVWKYHKVNKIPKNLLYEKTDRNGCMPCTGYKNWRENLVSQNKDMYVFISKDMGQPLLEEWCK